MLLKSPSDLQRTNHRLPDTPAPRVGYLVSQYPAINHTFVLREIRELRRLGVDVRVISVRMPDRPPEEMTSLEQEEARRATAILGLPISVILRMLAGYFSRHPLSCFRGLRAALGETSTSARGLVRELAYFVESVVAGELFLRSGIEHFHVHFSSTVGLLITKMFPLKMSVSLHGPAEFLEGRSFHLREKIQAAAFVRAISSFGSSQAMLAAPRCDWQRIETLRLGVDTTSYRTRPLAPAHSRVVELLCVARLNHVKGQHLLLEAVREVLAAGLPVHLTLVGDGPDRASLERHAAQLELGETVRFTGWVNQDRLATMYAEADLFVLPSFAEGIPVVLMEAMAAELPVIATWVAGVPELVEHGRNGWLCPPGETGALANAIVRLGRDSALRRRLALAGRRTVLDQYDLRTNVLRLAEAMTERGLLADAWRADVAERAAVSYAAMACR